MATSGKSCYGLLTKLEGKWHGTGMTIISLPYFNKKNPKDEKLFTFRAFSTKEVLNFKKIKDPIPDRGRTIRRPCCHENSRCKQQDDKNSRCKQQEDKNSSCMQGQEDINMYGLEYKQNVFDNDTRELIHSEKGEFLNVPATDVLPKQGRTILRMATILHANALIAQSTSIKKISGAPVVPNIDSTPTGPCASDPGYLDPIFKDAKLPPNVTFKNIKNPNRIIQKQIKQLSRDYKVLKTTEISMSTKKPGGGIVNSLFVKENANTTKMDVTFWIVKLSDKNEKISWQLFYSQTVILEFDGIKWPHISVGRLFKKKLPHFIVEK
jgi:hypothetical protein